MNREAIEVMTKTLEAQIHTKGWDKPPFFVLVTGSYETPEVRATEMDEFQGHPIEYLVMLWEQGLRLDETFIGSGFITESWRHMEFEQAVKTPGHMVNKLRAQAIENKDEAPPTPEGESFEDALDKALERIWNETLPRIPPSSMPLEHRLEARHASIQFRNNECMVLSRARGEDEAHVYWIESEDKAGGRMFEAIEAFMRGENPDVDGDFS